MSAGIANCNVANWNLLKYNFCSAKFKSLFSWKKHVLSSHAFDANFKIVCNIDGCLAKLNDILSLRKYLFRNHKGKRWTVPKTWYKEIPVLLDDTIDFLALSKNNAKSYQSFFSTSQERDQHDDTTLESCFSQFYESKDHEKAFEHSAVSSFSL